MNYAPERQKFNKIVPTKTGSSEEHTRALRVAIGALADGIFLGAVGGAPTAAREGACVPQTRLPNPPPFLLSCLLKRNMIESVIINV